MAEIAEATPIILKGAERSELDGLARSTKTPYRLRQRARIVLLAADGMATRAIGRAVGCTTGTASKWRVRYADKRRAGLDETGNTFVGNVIQPMPDYHKAADGYGGAGERVTRSADLATAIARGLAAVAGGRTYILDVLVDP